MFGGICLGDLRSYRCQAQIVFEYVQLDGLSHCLEARGEFKRTAMMSSSSDYASKTIIIIIKKEETNLDMKSKR